MTATEYEQQAHRTIAGHAAENITYLSFGLMAEAGEVADKIAKAVRRGDIVINNNEIVGIGGGSVRLVGDIADELGDVLWFVTMLARRHGFSLEEIMRRNLDKLADRQARAVIVGDAAENITYLSFGLMAEAGEVADKIAKAVRRGDIVINNNEIVGIGGGSVRLVGDIADELGDVLWFVTMLARRHGFSLEEIMRRNLDKLADRQARGVIIGDGDKR